MTINHKLVCSLFVLLAPLPAMAQQSAEQELMRRFLSPDAYEKRMDNIERMEAMTPEERDAYKQRIQQENFQRIAPLPPTQAMPNAPKPRKKPVRKQKRIKPTNPQVAPDDGLMQGTY